MNFIKFTRYSIKNYAQFLKGSPFVNPNVRNVLYSTNADYKIDLKINNVPLTNYINSLQDEYQQLCKGTSQSNDKTGRWQELTPIIKLLEKRTNVVSNIQNLKELLNEDDSEIRKLAEEEKEHFEHNIKEIDEQIVLTLLPQDQEDYSSMVLEVNSGVGGQEAMLFAKEMFDMYAKFSEYKGWKFEILDYQTSDLGGIRHAAALVNGNSSFSYYKHEAGVHRVQRTPSTEKSGRVHTSTVSVVALPQPDEIQIKINPNDLKIETKRATGAGGQHVNTTDSAVRIVHLPTGISVECQVDRSQIKNRKLAMAKLNALLYQKELDSQIAETSATRKSQVKTNFRNEKIRTYNFNQDRITDHRLQGCNVHNLKEFFEGGPDLEDLIVKLSDQEKVNMLLDIVNNFNNK